MVLEAGLEPASLRASDFKSDVYTDSTTQAFNNHIILLTASQVIITVKLSNSFNPINRAPFLYFSNLAHLIH